VHHERTNQAASEVRFNPLNSSLNPHDSSLRRLRQTSTVSLQACGDPVQAWSARFKLGSTRRNPERTGLKLEASGFKLEPRSASLGRAESSLNRPGSSLSSPVQAWSGCFQACASAGKLAPPRLKLESSRRKLESRRFKLEFRGVKLAPTRITLRSSCSLDSTWRRGSRWGGWRRRADSNR
jgi:hypothetical protein